MNNSEIIQLQQKLIKQLLDKCNEHEQIINNTSNTQLESIKNKQLEFKYINIKLNNIVVIDKYIRECINGSDYIFNYETEQFEPICMCKYTVSHHDYHMISSLDENYDKYDYYFDYLRYGKYTLIRNNDSILYCDSSLDISNINNYNILLHVPHNYCIDIYNDYIEVRDPYGKYAKFARIEDVINKCDDVWITITELGMTCNPVCLNNWYHDYDYNDNSKIYIGKCLDDVLTHKYSIKLDVGECPNKYYTTINDDFIIYMIMKYNNNEVSKKYIKYCHTCDVIDNGHVSSNMCKVIKINKNEDVIFGSRAVVIRKNKSFGYYLL